VWRSFRRYKAFIISLFILFIPIFFLYTQKKIPAVQITVSSVVLDVFQVAQKGILSFTEKINDFYYRYWSSVNSYDELIYLRNRVKSIHHLKIALTEAQNENERLRELIQFSESIEGPRILAAGVIGRTGTPLSRTIQINKGSKNGIQRGDGVINAAGAIGQVLATGNYSSKVLLMTDASSAIDVIVERSRAHGIVRGVSNTHHYALKVKDFDRLHDVEVNDIIVTSGVGAKFPTGIPVGIVTAVRFNKEGLYVEADIKPYTQFDHIEEVLVLTQGEQNKPWRRKEMTTFLMEQSLNVGFAQGK